MASDIKISSTNFQNVKILSNICDVNTVLKKISPRWKMTILYDLSKGNQQFSKLKAKYPTLSDQVLSKRLHELEADGFISKEAIKQRQPQQIIYKVTHKGTSLLAIMVQLNQWALEWDQI